MHFSRTSLRIALHPKTHQLQNDNVVVENGNCNKQHLLQYYVDSNRTYRSWPPRNVIWKQKSWDCMKNLMMSVAKRLYSMEPVGDHLSCHKITLEEFQVIPPNSSQRGSLLFQKSIVVPPLFWHLEVEFCSEFDYWLQFSNLEVSLQQKIQARIQFIMKFSKAKMNEDLVSRDF